LLPPADTMATLSAVKAQSRAREYEERKHAERRRNVLVLMLRHLADAGYVDSFERLCAEANLSLDRVDAADNVDLASIIQEYEEGYEVRFGRKPKLVRKVAEEVATGGGGVRIVPAPGRTSSSGSLTPSSRPPGKPVSGAMAARERRERGMADAEKKKEQLERRKAAMNSVQAPPEVGAQRIAGVTVSSSGVAGGPPPEVGFESLSIQGNKSKLSAPGAAEAHDTDEDPDAFFDRRVLKPLPDMGNGEMRELAATIQRDIYMRNPNVRWEDIAGLEGAITLIKEAVVQPIKYPQFFTGLLAPWKGVLLYGPPGTGKTLLAKAVATECRTTFFNISATSIVSKWRGDSEKLVRVLFELARHHAPSTIFIDEVDSLMSSRGGEGEHEASRRMKTELLIQMDGLAKTDELVFVLGATNLPWELDVAMMRRLEKRILVPLPNKEAREVIFRKLLTGRGEGVDFERLSRQTDGYSGADVTQVAKEAAMRPLRRLMSELEAGVTKTDSAAEAKPGPITLDDIEGALSVTSSTASADVEKYTEFSRQYGQILS